MMDGIDPDTNGVVAIRSDVMTKPGRDKRTARLTVRLREFGQKVVVNGKAVGASMSILIDEVC